MTVVPVALVPMLVALAVVMVVVEVVEVVVWWRSVVVSRN